MRSSRIAVVLLIGDLMLVPLSLFLASQIRVIVPLGRELGLGGELLPPLVYLAAMAIWAGSYLPLRVYEVDRPPADRSSLIRLISAGATATLAFAGVLYLTYREVSRLQFIYFLLLVLAGQTAFRLVLDRLVRIRRGSALLPRQPVIVIGAGRLGREVAERVRSNAMAGYEVLGFVDDRPDRKGRTAQDPPVLGTTHQLRELVEQKRASEVWSTLPPHAYDRLYSLIAELDEVPVRIKIIPDYLSLALVQAKVEVLDNLPMIGLREPIISGAERLAKRAFDLVLSTFFAIALAPLMTLIGLAVRLESPGGAIFRQPRAGENGRTFDMLKFRTMRAVSPPPDTGSVADHKRKYDPRVTRLGRLLRRFSLDELPQLFNVIRGEMSLVGPRPELPWLVDRYQPWQRKRFAVPQGVTGWWQINGRSDKPMHLNTEDDLYYIYNYSIWLDIRILLRTPLVVLRGTGAF